MRHNHRIRVLARILKNAGYMSDLVSRVLNNQKSAPSQTEQVPYSTLGVSLGPGTSVMIPANPVKPDGSVDFVISFKAIGVGDTKGAGRMGTNAVVISTYLPDKKDEAGKIKFASYKKYGAHFVNRAIAAVLSVLQKATPDRKLSKGKLAIMWWSGGYTAGSQILREMPGEVDAAISIDGMHSGYSEESKDRSLAPFIQFAEAARQDPNKQFIMISTGVEPTNYAGTAETAQHVAQRVGLDTAMQTPSGDYVGNAPSGIASSNGLSWIQFVPPSERPGHYSLRQMKRQHGDAYRWGRDNINQLLGWN